MLLSARSTIWRCLGSAITATRPRSGTDFSILDSDYLPAPGQTRWRITLLCADQLASLAYMHIFRGMPRALYDFWMNSSMVAHSQQMVRCWDLLLVASKLVTILTFPMGRI